MQQQWLVQKHRTARIQSSLHRFYGHSTHRQTPRRIQCTPRAESHLKEKKISHELFIWKRKSNTVIHKELSLKFNFRSQWSILLVNVEYQWFTLWWALDDIIVLWSFPKWCQIKQSIFCGEVWGRDVYRLLLYYTWNTQL